jgi:nucleoside-diphosphate-sugar epimerase
VAQREYESLQVDISKNSELLGWVPPIDVDTAMRRTVGHFLDTKKI